MTKETILTAYREYLEKDFDKAETRLSNFLEHHPNDLNGLQLGSLTALSIKEFQLARHRAERALRLFGNSFDLLHIYGNILHALGMWSEAEEAYRGSLSIDPSEQKVWEDLVIILLESGKPNCALEEVSKMLDQFGDLKTFRYFEVETLIQMSRYDDALDIIESFDESSSDHARLLRARIYESKNLLNSVYNELGSIHPNSDYSPQALALLCNALAKQGLKYEIEAALVSRCENQNTSLPTSIEAINQLRRYTDRKTFKEFLNKAYALHGHHPHLVGIEASHALRNGNASHAVALLKTAILKEPKDLGLLTVAAQSAIVTQDFDLAEKLILTAINQAPNNQLFWALHATLERAKGAEESSLFDYRDFVKEYEIEPPEPYKSIKEFNSDLKKCLLKYHQTKEAPADQSFKGGTQTLTDLYYANEPVLRAFFKAVDAPIREYIANLDFDKTHPFLRRNTGNYRINGAWSVSLAPNGHHHNHVHPMGWMSSSYYVDVPESVTKSKTKNGWLKFGEPEIPGINLNPEKYIKPRAGLLVLFPSYMWHGTTPFGGQQKRLTLPFDILPN